MPPGTSHEQAGEGERAFDQEKRRDEHRKPSEERLRSERAGIGLARQAKHVKGANQNRRATQVKDDRARHDTSVDR